MASDRGPDFEPVFGSRETEGELRPRLRDRREQSDADPGGSLSSLVEEMESHRTVGDLGRSSSEPGTPAAGPIRDAERGPTVPTGARADDDGASAAHADPTPPSGTGSQQRVGTRWFRIRRRILTASVAAICFGGVYFLVSLLQVWSTGRSDSEGPAHAIVVMGAAQYDGRPSPQLAARLDHVVEIWPEGVAPLVVVTGGNIPGDRFTEAEASAAYLIDRGIPADAIILENTGSTSHESLSSVSEMLATRGLDDVVIVTDPYHALRSRLIAEEVGLDADVSSTDTSVVTGFDSFSRHVKEAGGVAIGRIIGFDRLADLVD